MRAMWYLFCLWLPTCIGYKILIPQMGNIKSLTSWFASLGVILAQNGHTVDMISTFPIANVPKNMTVLVKPQFEVLLQVSMFNVTSPLDFDAMVRQYISGEVKMAYNDPQILDFWKRRNDYDIIILMSYFHEWMFPFLMDFHGQFVQVITPGVESISLSRQGNWMTPSVVPEIQLHYDQNMSFLERIINVPASVLFYWWGQSYSEHCIREARKFFPELKSYQSYYDRVALSLINGHYAIDGPVPLLPNQVEVGTLNIKKSKPLPKDLDDFANGSGEAGFIYFSLGSVAKSADIPPAALAGFIEAFRRIPQRVIWKFDAAVKDLPPNVITRAWMPQQDILNHPKARAFISHCGNQGTQEAKYFGVPVLGIPIAFDQPRNAAMMERKKQAIVLSWDQITPHRIIDALNTLINDTSYKERMDQVSIILRDQKETPAERAIWWIEYVARHKDAPQLEYAGKSLYLFQYIMIDVMLFWAAVFSIFFYFLIRIVKYIFTCRPFHEKPKLKTK